MVSSVAGSGAGVHWPADFQPSTIAASRRAIGVSLSAWRSHRLELAVGLLGLGVLVVGVEGLDQRGERDELVGLLLDRQPGGGLGEAEVAGVEVGPGERVLAHPGRLGERLERGEGLALRQLLVAFELGDERRRSGRVRRGRSRRGGRWPPGVAGGVAGLVGGARAS